MPPYSSLAPSPDTVAAVDLGSNSFHMIVAHLDNGQLKIIDRLRESVRLGAGLDERKQLTPEAQQRALDCLSRFGQRLRALPHRAVRVVGTNTLRQLRDGGAFLRTAAVALGHPIEVIAGREEARLIYLGVAHGLAVGPGQRLVVDIGGGSTELILGQGMKPRERESLFMGCVSMSQRFFPDGKVTQQAMERAVTHCRLELRPVRAMFSAPRWRLAVGSSGTIKAIRNITQAMGWNERGISRSGLKKLRKALVAAGHVDKVQLEGLNDERRPVLAGGVAVLSAVFRSLDIEEMLVSDLSLREGVLYEMLGIIQHQDTRDRTVVSLIKRFWLDHQQAERVANTAAGLLGQVAEPWQLGDPDHAHLLGWASRLHEIGLIVSHNSFHKHGAYILANADMPGFSRGQQAVLAALVRGHRRKFPNEGFEPLGDTDRLSAVRLCVLLRLAVLLHRGRSGGNKPWIRLAVTDDTLNVHFPAGWLEEHPLTSAEMDTEAGYLQGAGFVLTYE
jgi:exopolyphosphatase / guanosine-5'-triphosphate,3'-diphosphate pyrophosphatase